MYTHTHTHTCALEVAKLCKSDPATRSWKIEITQKQGNKSCISMQSVESTLPHPPTPMNLSRTWEWGGGANSCQKSLGNDTPSLYTRMDARVAGSFHERHVLAGSLSVLLGVLVLIASFSFMSKYGVFTRDKGKSALLCRLSVHLHL